MLISTFHISELLLHSEYNWSEKTQKKWSDQSQNVASSFDRKDGKQVLKFINQLAQKHEFICQSSCHKIEQLLKKCPNDLKTSEQVEDWLASVWEYS